MSHVELSHIDSTNLHSIHNSLGTHSSALSAIMQKIESSLQTSIAIVTWRNDECSSYKIRFGDELHEKPAVLAFDKKLYSIIGIPKMEDKVIVIHNNGNNAHILFVSNDKNVEDPPLYGSTTSVGRSISSSKCMG